MNRRAMSVTETVVAVLVLGVASGLVLRFAVQIKEGLQQRELSSRLTWELLNAREQIGSWSVKELTESRIAELPFSDDLSMQVSDLRWEVELSEIDSPVDAKQVDLSLCCRYGGQEIKPRQLTFWVLAKPEQSTPTAQEKLDE